MFCDDDNYKLVPESTQPRVFPSWTIVNNTTKKIKSEDLLLERKVYNDITGFMWLLFFDKAFRLTCKKSNSYVQFQIWNKSEK